MPALVLADELPIGEMSLVANELRLFDALFADDDDDDEVFDKRLSIENGLMSGLVVTLSGKSFEK